MKRILVALLLLAGCSNKPQQVEVIIKSDKPAMTAEQKAEEERLKKINEFFGPAIDALGKFTEETGNLKGDESLRAANAIIAIHAEEEVIKKRDGDLAAAKFMHAELVGKSLGEVVAKWAPRYVESKP